MALDFVTISAAAVAGAFVVMSVVMLSKYRAASRALNDSAGLAKDLWQALEARIHRQDERMVDLMARVELYGVQLARANLTGPEPDWAERTAPKDRPEPITVRGPMTQTPPTEASVEAAGKTELEILRSLSEGPRTSVEIMKGLARSREHTARLMKTLFEKGLVGRETMAKPYVYRLTDRGRRYLEGTSA